MKNTTISLSALITILITIAGLISFGGAGSHLESLEIVSEESKTALYQNVSNRISWLKQGQKDIWLMEQSHWGGAAASPGMWDQLAIVIDLSTSPITARYYQLEPLTISQLDVKSDVDLQLKKKAVPFKVACTICHSNGLRVIRPHPGESQTLDEHLKTFTWNLKIKSYGRVALHPDHLNPSHKDWAVKFESDFMNEPLRVKTCVLCHKNAGFLARGELKRQNIPTISFMMKRGHMPPLGISLSDAEQTELENFINGF